MNANNLPGSFPLITAFNNFQCVAVDFPQLGPGSLTVNTASRTNGIYAATPLTASPTQSHAWAITGFSVSLHFAIGLNRIGPASLWGRMGVLWAGILVNRPAPSPPPGPNVLWPPAEFPPDLSTFQQIWNGESDSVNVIDGLSTVALGDIRNYTIITESVQLPQPIPVNPGTQLAFALVLTPSICESTMTPVIKDCTYNINYTE